MPKNNPKNLREDGLEKKGFNPPTHPPEGGPIINSPSISPSNSPLENLITPSLRPSLKPFNINPANSTNSPTSFDPKAPVGITYTQEIEIISGVAAILIALIAIIVYMRRNGNINQPEDNVALNPAGGRNEAEMHNRDSGRYLPLPTNEANRFVIDDEEEQGEVPQVNFDNLPPELRNPASRAVSEWLKDLKLEVDRQKSIKNHYCEENVELKSQIRDLEIEKNEAEKKLAEVLSEIEQKKRDSDEKMRKYLSSPDQEFNEWLFGDEPNKVSPQQPEELITRAPSPILGNTTATVMTEQNSEEKTGALKKR